MKEKGNMMIKMSGIETSSVKEGYYPSLSIPESAISFENNKIGTIVELKVKGRIKGLYSDRDGGRAELEIHHAEMASESEEQEDMD